MYGSRRFLRRGGRDVVLCRSRILSYAVAGSEGSPIALSFIRAKFVWLELKMSTNVDVYEESVLLQIVAPS